MFGITQAVSASHSLRVLGVLLRYPNAQMRAHLPEMREILRREGTLSVERQAELGRLIDTLGGAESLDVEAGYVQLFDCSRATSLHLFEHVHGDSRERGPAMIDLAQTYEKAGLYLTSGELPDYLPVVLEFVSTQPPAEARAFLGEMAHILNALFNALRQCRSAYAGVLGALLDLAGETARTVASATDLALDDSWAEPPVFNGCSTSGQAKPGQPQPIHFIRKNAQSGVAP